jgi:hypothetical protein
MSEKLRRGNGIGIRVRRDVRLIAPPAGQFADVVQGFEVQRAGAFLQYRIAKGLRPGLQRERMVPAHLDGLWKIWRSRSCALLLISQRVCFGALRPPMPMLRVPTAALFERIDERGHDPRTASTQRVAERDGTAVDICPF